MGLNLEHISVVWGEIGLGFLLLDPIQNTHDVSGPNLNDRPYLMKDMNPQAGVHRTL
jgi:hypothetical protein